jgi:predicted AAA+ superfamily ATPase
MKRLIEERLIEWKRASRRKPLMVRGARQVGKTWSIETFGQNHFKSMLKVDLEKRTDLHTIFQDDLSSKTVLSRLGIASRQKIKAGETLLFLDEIQACPRALMALRYFYEERPELHVIAAGSLLDFALGEIPFPVGRVQFVNMYPMTFAEFLLAGGHEQLCRILKEPPTKIDEFVHNLIITQLKNYFFTGGMPEAVQAYLDSEYMLEAFDVQSEILAAYRLDFAKYAPRADKLCLDQVLSGCATRVGDQIMYSQLTDSYSNPTIRKAFELLCMAKVLQKIPSVKRPVVPLGSLANNRKFKASIIDIGLMQRLNHLPVDVEIRQENLLAIYRGKFTIGPGMHPAARLRLTICSSTKEKFIRSK